MSSCFNPHYTNSHSFTPGLVNVELMADAVQVPFSPAKFAAWGLAVSAVMDFCMYPLELVKTRIQQTASPAPPTNATTIGLRSVYRTEGVRGLFSGCMFSLIGSVPVHGLYFGPLEYAKVKMEQSDWHTTAKWSHTGGLFAIGALSEVTSGVVYVPIDIISQRMMVWGAHKSNCNATGHCQTQKNQKLPFALSLNSRISNSNSISTGAATVNLTTGLKSAHSNSGDGKCCKHARGILFRVQGGAYPKALHIAKDIVAKEGVRGLYRGFGATMAAHVPSSAITWSVYESGKREFGLRGITECAWWGCISGVIGSVATHPMDFAKTRIQVQEKERGKELVYKKTWQTIRHIYKYEGGMSLWTRGLQTRLLYIVPVSWMSFAFYEFVKKKAGE